MERLVRFRFQATKLVKSNAIKRRATEIICFESENGTTPDFDCGLATESMFIAAHSLGLGARIYGSPTGKINSTKDLFQISPGYKAVIVLRIGNTDKTVDAVSAATPRKKFEEVVNYIK